MTQLPPANPETDQMAAEIGARCRKDPDAPAQLKIATDLAKYLCEAFPHLRPEDIGAVAIHTSGALGGLPHQSARRKNRPVGAEATAAVNILAVAGEQLYTNGGDDA